MAKAKKILSKNNFINIALLVGALFLVLLILECLMRIFFPQSQYAITWAPWGFTHKPNTSITYYNELAEFDKEAHPIPVHYNSKGLRDYEYEYLKSDGTFRILLLGDSWAEDMGSFLENLHAKRLEKRLNSFNLSIKFEVINAGHYAFDNAQEFMYYLREGKRYHPDIVMLMYAGDTASSEYAVLEDGALKLKYKEFTISQKVYRNMGTLIRTHSHFGSFVMNRLSRIGSLNNLLRASGLKEKNPILAKFPEGHVNLGNIAQEDKEIADKIILKSTNLRDFSLVDRKIWQRFKEEVGNDGGTFVFINNLPKNFSENDKKFLNDEDIVFFSIQWDPEEVKKRKKDDIAKGEYDKFLDSHRFGYKQHPIVAEQILNFLVENELVPYAYEML